MTSVPTTVLKSSSDSKKLIKWKDAPTGNTYWQVIELDKGHNRSINKAMDIKPIALLQQTKVLKFDRTRREPTVPRDRLPVPEDWRRIWPLREKVYLQNTTAEALLLLRVLDFLILGNVCLR